MKKLFVLFVCLAVCMVKAGGVFAEKTISAKKLPPIVAQACGQANTVIMWHDINDDGKADYKTAYVFKDGKLHQLSKSKTLQEVPGLLIRER